ncbi:MAG: SDR family NAD(P)-dependent oxidoreductase, partial [Hyphomicrobiales bacterium]
MKLNGKIAVVTGASSGIGAGIAKAMAAEGATVIVNYNSSKSGADTVVASIKAAGGKAVAMLAPMPLDAPVTTAIFPLSF